MLRLTPTFPFVSAHLEPAGRSVHSRRRPFGRARRGFTLIELMVVVLIITISAAIAMPGIANRMKSNRTKVAADAIATLYRNARMRAMGRGSAILVTYNGTSGRFAVREAIRGANSADAGCAQLPETSCLEPNRWNAAPVRSQEIDSANFMAGDFVTQRSATDGTALGVQNLDVCFSPAGRSFSRSVAAAPLDVMTAPVRFEIWRDDGVGFRRAVVVSPTGMARAVGAP